MKQDFFVYRVSFLRPLLNSLKNNKVNLTALIRRCEIRYFDLTFDNNCIPSFVVYEFLHELKKNIDLKLLFESTCYNKGFYYQSDFGNYIRNCPNLKKALMDFTVLSKIRQTNLRSTLKVGGANSTFTFEFIDRAYIGKKIAELTTLTQLLNVFERYCEIVLSSLILYVPEENIGIVSGVVSRTITVIGHSDSVYRLVFSNSLLVASSKIDSTFTENKKLNFKLTDTVTIVTKVVESYESGYLPSLQELSKHFNISRSTMRRVLLTEKTQFSKILEDVLFMKAVRLLSASNMNIILISEYLGYSESANFIRSFKKWTGITPGEYRESKVSILETSYENSLITG